MPPPASSTRDHASVLSGIPRPPEFTSTEAARIHIKQRLAAAFRLCSRFGFDEGVAGHITARDPEHSDTFWVNPFAMHFSMIKASDLVRVDGSGGVIEGSRPINEAAFAIHSQVHVARPDVQAAAHAHSLYGKAWSSFGRLLTPLTQDACAFYNDHSLFDDYTGVVVDVNEGKRIATALGEHKALVLRNHGLLTVGHSVDEAAWWLITLERSCQVQLVVETAGRHVKIDDSQAQLTANQIGGHYVGWLNFQPLYEWIVTEEPDLLD